MVWNEFALIAQYLEKHAGKRSDVLLGIGDDCSLLKVPDKKILAVTIDALVEGIHFLANTPAYFLGFKSLAISLSDLAAIGAEPAWVTLALVLDDKATEKWMEEFCRGFSVLLREYNLQLVGGNISRGHLSITTQLHGFLSEGKGLLRSGAKVGDLIYVTGNLGEAGRALALLKNDTSANENELDFLRQKLFCPTPRVREGMALLDVANAAVDISDGLAADLQHVLDGSGVGASIYVDKLPISLWLQQSVGASSDGNVDWEHAWRLALSAGDDYELCFTVAAANVTRVDKIAKKYNCTFTNIGVVEEAKGLRIKHTDGRDFVCSSTGYVHKFL